MSAAGARPTILVTGATGKTGTAVALQLRSLDWPVRAVVHSRDARTERLRSAGAEVVQADIFDVEQLREAIRGTTRAYYCPPWHPHMLHSAASFAVAVQEAKLEVVVGLSQWLASPSHPSLATRQSWLADHLFSRIPGVGHVVVNPGFFADNYLRLIGFAAQLGLFPMPLGTGRNAPPSNEDIARVVVGALIAPERHVGKTYRPTGPKLLSAADIAATMGKVLGRRVRHVDMPMWMFLKALRALGIDEFQQTGLRYYIEEHQRGSFEIGAPTEHVREVTGQEPESFETITRRYARERPDAQRTLGNGLRALWDFSRIGLTPAFALDRFERLQAHPRPAASRLAIDADAWRLEHVDAPASV